MLHSNLLNSIFAHPSKQRLTKLRSHKPLTDKDLLYLLENDSPEVDAWANEDAATDLDDEDIVEEVRPEGEVIEFD